MKNKLFAVLILALLLGVSGVGLAAEKAAPQSSTISNDDDGVGRKVPGGARGYQKDPAPSASVTSKGDADETPSAPVTSTDTTTPVSATTSSDVTTNLTPDADACGHKDIIGKDLEDVDQKKVAETVQVLHPGDTPDVKYEPGRVNIIVDDKDVVTDVTCG